MDQWLKKESTMIIKQEHESTPLASSDSVTEGPTSMENQTSAKHTVEDISNNQPDENNSVSATLKRECERLNQRVKQLEAERDRDGQALKALQTECNHYRRALYAWAQEQFMQREPQLTDQELTLLMEEGKGVPLEDFLGELEHIIEGQ
jgi:hypothetical protein